jgi:hypothetical protein
MWFDSYAGCHRTVTRTWTSSLLALTLSLSCSTRSPRLADSHGTSRAPALDASSAAVDTSGDSSPNDRLDAALRDQDAGRSQSELQTAVMDSTRLSSEVHVTWTVDQSKAVPKYVPNTDLTKYRVPVQVKLQYNNKEVSAPLTGNAGVVFLNVGLEQACRGVRFFWAGLGIEFEVRRNKQGEGELTKHEWAEMAYERRTRVLKFDYPSGVKVIHHLTLTGVDGTTKSEQCVQAENEAPSSK